MQKNGQKVIGCETSHKTGEMPKMGAKKPRKTANSKNGKPPKISSAKNDGQMP
jgi:hypothetical protein